MKMYALGEILRLNEVTPLPGKPAWANVKPSRLLKKREWPDELAGGGVYACFWKNELIYIGKFVHSDGDPLGGTVYVRIEKHAAGFLQRDQRLFFHPGPFDGVLNMGGAIADDLRAAEKDALVYIKNNKPNRGMGVCSTENKVRWAQSQWSFIRAATTNDIMDHFTFGYARIEVPAGGELRSKRLIDIWVGTIEKALIADFYPPCNDEFTEARRRPAASPDQVRVQFGRRFAEIQMPSK